MTQAARDERDIVPYNLTLAGGPEDQALAIDAPSLDPGLDQGDREVTYDTRESAGYNPDDYRWQPITDPAEVAAIEGALAQGIDPPYEVWVDQAPAALPPGDLTPLEEGPTVYAWEQTGPAVGEGQLYEVTDPVVLAAYAEAHPAPGAVEIVNPADYDEAATLAPAPALYDAQIDALADAGATWLEVEETRSGFALGRYEAGPFERDTNAWEPRRLGDGPDDGPTGNAYPDEAAARQAAIAYNGADLAPDLTPAFDL